ncbi:hypothetical protein Egran_03333 [Elaphomyces granulatus]|uniref:HAT C-terminal dimerisation domain-containing protein n=1 Tax=Elaphomyces granulatus TaxID=519963 RepID=A0A232LXU8_9EURO|nr:hypothetical protein Egran_03333 [Elaphomyces granulatus]
MALASLQNDQDFSLSVFRALLLRWIVNDNIAFRKVDNKNIQALLIYLEWRLEGNIASRFPIRRWIMDASAKHTKVIKAQLAKSQSLIHLSFDLWTSRSLLSLNGIVVHFVDETFEARRAKRLKQGLDYFIDKETLEERARIGGSDAGYVVENRLSKEDWEILEEYEEYEEYVEFLDQTAISLPSPDLGATSPELSIPSSPIEIQAVRKWNHHLQWRLPRKSSRATQGLAANVLLVFEYILNHMEKMNENTEYYRKLDDTPIYIAGVILHPSHKWQRLPDDPPREQSTQSEFEMFLEGRSQKDPLAPLDEYDKWCQLEPFDHHNALSYWIENRS